MPPIEACNELGELAVSRRETSKEYNNTQKDKDKNEKQSDKITSTGCCLKKSHLL